MWRSFRCRSSRVSATTRIRAWPIWWPTRLSRHPRLWRRGSWNAWRRPTGWLAWAGLQAGNAAQAVIHTAAVGLERLGAALVQQSERLLQSERNRLGRAEELLRTAPADLLRDGERRLTAASELLLSYSVERVLRRGFAVVRRGGEALRSVEGLAAGDRIDITLADGEVQAAVVAFTKQKQDDNG